MRPGEGDIMFSGFIPGMHTREFGHVGVKSWELFPNLEMAGRSTFDSLFLSCDKLHACYFRDILGKYEWARKLAMSVSILGSNFRFLNIRVENAL